MGTRSSNRRSGSIEIRMHGGTKAPIIAGIAALTGVAGAAVGALTGRRLAQNDGDQGGRGDDGSGSHGSHDAAHAAGRPAPASQGQPGFSDSGFDRNGLPDVASGVVSKDASQSPANELNDDDKKGDNEGEKKDGLVKSLTLKFDAFQQRHSWAALPYAVIKKFGDDEAGNLAALIAYYGIGSLFPLLLVFLTVMGFVLASHPDLQGRILNSTFSQFPIVGDQIRSNVHSLHGSGVGLAIGLVLTLYGGLGVANAAQTALNRVWEVPIRERPPFVSRLLRSLLLLVVVGGGIIGTSILTGMGSGSGVLGFGFRAAVLAVSVVLNIGLFALAFRILTVRDVPWKRLLPGAVLAGVAWQLLQAVGGYYVGHGLKGASQSYGFFAVVLGLMSWLYLEAQLMLLAAEVNVVLAGRLWPRALTQEQRTDADERAYAAYAEVEERRHDEDVDVGFDARVEGEGTGTIERSDGSSRTEDPAPQEEPARA